MYVQPERLLPAERLARMRSYLQDRPESVVDLATLARLFAVSQQTVRRDLAVLEADGLVHRTFGGAVVQSSGLRVEPALHTRHSHAANLKAAIAEAARRYLRNEDGIYLDASTTVLALARRVPDDWQGSATTSSLPTVQELGPRVRGSLTLLGGQYRPSSECVGGVPALTQLATQRFATAFLSCRALSTRHGLTEAREDEAALKRLVIANSARVVLLVDSTKLETVAAHHFADIKQANVLVVDDLAPADLVAALREQVEVVVAAT